MLLDPEVSNDEAACTCEGGVTSTILSEEYAEWYLTDGDRCSLVDQETTNKGLLMMGVSMRLPMASGYRRPEHALMTRDSSVG